MAKKLYIEKIDRLIGMQTHELLREGASPTLDPIKISALFKILFEEFNKLVDEVEELKSKQNIRLEVKS